MTPRLTSRITVDAIMRRVMGEGGFAAVIAKGDDSAGAILLLCSERGVPQTLLERTIDPMGGYAWSRCGPQDIESAESRGADLKRRPPPPTTASPAARARPRDSYMQRRRQRDRDLWVVELDIPDAERFAAETTGFG